MEFLIVVSCAIGCFIIFQIWYNTTIGKFRNNKRMDGKVVVVTGATAGIGYYTALDLAQRGARLVLPCKNLEQGQAVVDTLKKLTPNDNIYCLKLDLSSFESVREFVSEFKKREKQLDVLICNAGVLHVDVDQTPITVDGIQEIFQVNYFSNFLMISLLIDMLKKSAPSRIILLSSVAYTMTKTIELDSLQSKASLGGFAYSKSKLAIMLFMCELSKRLSGTGVTVNAVHPGSCQSQLYDKCPAWLYWIITPLSKLFFRTSEQGAETTLYAAVSDELEGVSGRYLEECRISSLNKHAQNEDLSRRLWSLSEQLTSASYKI